MDTKYHHKIKKYLLAKYLSFSPELSAQLTTAPTGRPKVIRNLPPTAPPRPKDTQI